MADEQNQININVDPDKLEAKYSDQAFITSNPFGFTFDFGQVIPQMNIVKILSRVAMSPEHAKAFANALNNTLVGHEQQFGKIELTKKMKEETGKGTIGFNLKDTR